MVYDLIVKRKYADTYKNDRDDRSLLLKKKSPTARISEHNIKENETFII